MYTWDAKVYEKGAGNEQKWARDLIKKLQLNGAERILDVGCGEGRSPPKYPPV